MLGMIMGYSVIGDELRGFVQSGIHASGTASASRGETGTSERTSEKCVTVLFEIHATICHRLISHGHMSNVPPAPPSLTVGRCARIGIFFAFAISVFHSRASLIIPLVALLLTGLLCIPHFGPLSVRFSP